MFRSFPFIVALLFVSCTSHATPESQSVPTPVVRENSTNFAFTYADATGFHAVERVADVPLAARGTVRVEPLGDGTSRGLDPARVWVADLRTPGADGRFPVRAETRDAFEARARPTPRASAPSAAAGTPAATADVVLYSTSWCGVCRQARAFFQERGVAFVERDIENDPGAREEMMQKARAQGINPRGVPVIDVHGQIIPGFDRARIASLLTGI